MRRCGDLGSVTYSCISESVPGQIDMVLPKTKMDQQKKERFTCVLRDGPSARNAYCWLRPLLLAKPWQAREKVFSSRTVMNGWLGAQLEALHGGGNGHWSTHSLRRGGATRAHNDGVQDSAIMHAGGWKTPAVMLQYIVQDGTQAADWTAA
jgi:hypothetical protein